MAVWCPTVPSLRQVKLRLIEARLHSASILISYRLVVDKRREPASGGASHPSALTEPNAALQPHPASWGDEDSVVPTDDVPSPCRFADTDALTHQHASAYTSQGTTRQPRRPSCLDYCHSGGGGSMDWCATIAASNGSVTSLAGLPSVTKNGRDVR